jgi:hypothetical protein
MALTTRQQDVDNVLQDRKKQAPHLDRTSDLRMIANCNPTLSAFCVRIWCF